MEMGKLVVITGPMFSGKTTMLINLLAEAARSGRKVTMFKSDMDNRYSLNGVVTHDGLTFSAMVLPRGPECMRMLYMASNGNDVIGIDEGQFWHETEGFCKMLNQIAFAGKEVYVSLLNRDAMGEAFSIATEIMPHADEIHVLRSKCSKCGGVATFTQRVRDNAEQFGRQMQIGGRDLYEARCRKCFVRPPSPTSRP